jgi:hypothetical protein
MTVRLNFKSQLGHQTSWVRFCGFLQSLHTNARIVPQLEEQVLKIMDKTQKRYSASLRSAVAQCKMDLDFEELFNLDSNEINFTMLI